MRVAHALVALAAALSVVAVLSRSPARADQIVRIEHHDPSATPARGPVDAPVIVELFYVPQVNLAARQLNAYKALEALQAKHPTRVRLIFRVMRQGMISTAALEAHAQGKYFEFLDRIAGERSALSKEKLLELVKSIDLDPDRVAAAISQDRYAAAFNDNERRSRRLHLVNTPAVVFNSQPARFSMSSGNLRMDEVERTYTEAYERAVELMDQGIPASKLGEAYDAKVLASAPQAVVPPAEDDNESHDQLLVSPPLKLAGLPSVGDDGTSMPIVFLCSPLNTQCQKIMERTINLQKDVYPELRLTWAPWFDVGREDASDQILLGDAALCAEQLGTGAPPKSAGWLWVE
ncbi:MAG: DsbA family protein, partial [Proteobacteria bacterium]|nr:DsbA family protein [Pseudomonadota bacterium]